MKRMTLNLVIVTAIGLAFALSAVSGLAFLIPQSASTVPTVLGLDLLVWSDLHTVASLGMVGGVLLHLTLHMRWIAANLRRTLRPATVPIAVEGTVTQNGRHITGRTKRGLA